MFGIPSLGSIPLNLDVWTAIYAVVAVVFIIGGAFIIGRALDPLQRIKWMRSMRKRDYGLLYVLGKDRQNIIRSIMVDFLADRVIISKSRMDPGKELVWVIKEGHIYREDAVEKGSKLKFKIREGVPVAFVCEDNLQSVDFDIPKSGSSPQEAASLMNSFFANQAAKRSAGQEKPKSDWTLPVILIIGLILIVGYLIWQTQSIANDTRGMVIGINDTLSGATIAGQNGTGVIHGPTPIPTPTR